MAAERLPRVGQFFLPGRQKVNDRHGCLVAILAPDDAGRMPTVEAVTRLVAARIHLLPPRFRRALAPTPLRLAAPLLVDDQLFAAARHVRALAPADGTRAGFEAAMRDYARALLPGDRPLWEVALLPGLPDGRAALMVKLHHAIVEGEGALSSLGALLFARAPTAVTGEPQPWQPEPPPGGWQRLLLAVRDQGQRLAGVAAQAARAAPALLDREWRRAMAAAWRDQIAPRQPPSLFNRPVGDGFAQAVAEAEIAPLQALTARQPGNATLDDVILAGIAGGLRAWLAEQRLPAHDPVVQMPVATDRRGLAPRREFIRMPSFMVLPLPVGEPDRARRLAAIVELAAARRAQAPAAGAWLGPLAALPMPLYRRCAGRVYERIFHFHLASLRGPPITPYVLTSAVERAFIATPVRGTHAIRWAVMTLGGKVTIAFACDPAVVPAPERLAAAIEAELAALVAA